MHQVAFRKQVGVTRWKKEDSSLHSALFPILFLTKYTFPQRQVIENFKTRIKKFGEKKNIRS
jgi:hypothetical protein